MSAARLFRSAVFFFEKRKAIFLAAALIALAGGGRAEARLYSPETFTLPNGMEVAVIQNRLAPVVTHMVWYKVGSADEPAGKSGLAHLLEHMMFKGTRLVPSGEFSRTIAKNGGRDNAFTSSDYTAYYQNVAADKLELAMRLEADRMVNLALSDHEFQPERQVVLEERRMRSENEPQARLSEQMTATLFLNSPYRHPVIGWKNEIEKSRIEDLIAFYRDWYAPNNAILVVSGDVDPARVRALAEKHYGAIPRRTVALRDRAVEPPPIAARSVLLEDSSVTQPFWARDYLAPGFAAGKNEQVYALQVLTEILGGGVTGRFYQALVVEQELAATASVGYDPIVVGDGVFSISVMPRANVTPEQVGEAAIALIREVVEKGVSDKETEAAKMRLRARVAYARDSIRGSAEGLGARLAVGLTAGMVEAWPEKIGAVTTADVNRAARALLLDERSVTGVMKAGGEIQAEERKKGEAR